MYDTRRPDWRRHPDIVTSYEANDAELRKKSLEDQIDKWAAREISVTWPVAVGLIIEFYAVLSFAVTRNWNQYQKLVAFGGRIGPVRVPAEDFTNARIALGGKRGAPSPQLQKAPDDGPVEYGGETLRRWHHDRSQLASACRLRLGS